MRSQDPMPPLPPTALNLMRWEIIISWTIFPLVDAAVRLNLLELETGEMITCTADYAAKAGLAVILTNCNLEQVGVLLAEYLAHEKRATTDLLNRILPKVSLCAGMHGH